MTKKNIAPPKKTKTGIVYQTRINIVMTKIKIGIVMTKKNVSMTFGATFGS